MSKTGNKLATNKYDSKSILYASREAPNMNRVKAATIALIINGMFLGPGIANAKTELPSLEKCFNAVEKEVAPDGESITRLREDIKKGNWADVKAFSREYDSGFRGGVLKNAWKQLQGEEQKLGIEITNSFTFDLIALNKAARNEDTIEANTRLDQVKEDLKNFLKLRK
jgi:hypothetical protein